MKSKNQQIVRLLIAAGLFLVGAPTLLAGLICAFGSGPQREISHNREIEQLFQTTSRDVILFREQHGRLPSMEEFEPSARTIPSTPYSNPRNMVLQVDSFPEEAIKKLGTPPKDSFLLVYVRGEWDEYYAPWNGRTSLIFDESKFYLSGSKLVDGAVLVIIALVLLSIGHRIWPDPLFWRASQA